MLAAKRNYFKSSGLFPGNAPEKTTLRGMVERIQRRFGKAERIWVMERGIPTEEAFRTLKKDLRFLWAQVPAWRPAQHGWRIGLNYVALRSAAGPTVFGFRLRAVLTRPTCEKA